MYNLHHLSFSHTIRDDICNIPLSGATTSTVISYRLAKNLGGMCAVGPLAEANAGKISSNNHIFSYLISFTLLGGMRLDRII